MKLIDVELALLWVDEFEKKYPNYYLTYDNLRYLLEHLPEAAPVNPNIEKLL